MIILSHVNRRAVRYEDGLRSPDFPGLLQRAEDSGRIVGEFGEGMTCSVGANINVAAMWCPGELAGIYPTLHNSAYVPDQLYLFGSCLKSVRDCDSNITEAIASSMILQTTFLDE